MTFPVSIRLTAANSQVVAQNVFASSSPGVSKDTGLSYVFLLGFNSLKCILIFFLSSFSGGSQPPATQAPTQKPTTAPTTAPTQRPPTQAPTTAPTQKPTQPATQAPTQKPTQPATQAPTQKPTQPATQAPTQKPTQPATQAPTQKPTPTTGNPFSGTDYYLNPHYLQQVDSAIADYPEYRAKFSKVKDFASAYWIDRMSVIDNILVIYFTLVHCKRPNSFDH